MARKATKDTIQESSDNELLPKDASQPHEEIETSASTGVSGEEVKASEPTDTSGESGEVIKNIKEPKPPKEKKRVKNEELKGKSVFVFDGTLISFDENGVAEMETVYADYLLQIPSYMEA